MKNKSISRRLSIEIGLLMLSFSIVLLLANSLLLKPLYYYSVEKDMIDAMSLLSEIDYLDGTTDWTESIAAVDPGHAYDITIEYQGGIVYSSSVDIGVRRPGDNFQMQMPDGEAPQNMDMMDDKFREDRPFFPADKITDWEDLGDGVTMGLMDQAEGSKMFVSEKELDTGVKIYLTQGVEPLLKSVQQANILLIGVTVVFLGIAVLMAFRMSRNFTKPIRAMQMHVNKLSQLSFDSALEVATGDELQNLSEDINELASKLQEALSTLQKQNQQLERDIVSQRKFISNASHELRTPLALIKGYADEIVQGFVKDPAQQTTYVGYIASESTKMKRLLNEILELSRLESGRMTIEPMELSIHEIIEDFVDKYMGFIEDRHLRMNLELLELRGEVDPIRFEQVLANFISNAGKYATGDKHVRIRMEEMDQTLRITVSNSGGPIGDDMIHYIWDGFYKGDESRTHEDGSYGLGLSIVKAIQEASEQKYGCYNTEGYVHFWFDVKKSL